jgi:hypothetical protein
MPANSAPVCESIRAADGTEVTESAGITTVFREHYKQLVPHWRVEFDADNRPRDSCAGLVASQSTAKRTKYDEPFTKKEMERSRGPADIQLATLLTQK